MKLNEFIEWLGTQEFSQHNYGELNSAMIAKNLPKIIWAINRGITELHTKFLIKKGSLFLYTNGTQRRYELSPDSPLIRTDGCPLRLLEVLDIICCSDGRPVRMNATQRRCPEGTIEAWMPDQHHIEFNQCEGIYRINFRRDGEKIPDPRKYAHFKSNDFNVDVPDAYLNALLFYMATIVFAPTAPMDGYSATYNPAVIYRSKYQEEIQRLQALANNLSGVGNYEQRFEDSTLP